MLSTVIKMERKEGGEIIEEATDLDSATRRNSLSGTVELGGPATPKELEAGIANQVEEEVIVVDWDGPDDPLNPKKCV